MSALRWEKIEGEEKYGLHFEEYYKDVSLGTLYWDDGWCFDANFELFPECLYEEDLEAVKSEVEDRIEEQYQIEIEYYTDLLRQFKEARAEAQKERVERE